MGLIRKIIGPFHFTVCLLGTEILSFTLFTEENQSLGTWEDEGTWGPEEYGDGPLEGMTDEDVDAMLDAMLEARERAEDEGDDDGQE